MESHIFMHVLPRSFEKRRLGFFDGGVEGYRKVSLILGGCRRQEESFELTDNGTCRQTHF